MWWISCNGGHYDLRCMYVRTYRQQYLHQSRRTYIDLQVSPWISSNPLSWQQ